MKKTMQNDIKLKGLRVIVEYDERSSKERILRKTNYC